MGPAGPSGKPTIAVVTGSPGFCGGSCRSFTVPPNSTYYATATVGALGVNATFSWVDEGGAILGGIAVVATASYQTAWAPFPLAGVTGNTTKTFYLAGGGNQPEVADVVALVWQ